MYGFAALSHHQTFYAPLDMAFAQNAGRLLGKRPGILCSLELMSEISSATRHCCCCGSG